MPSALSGGTIHGRVVDLPTAHGVPGARVTASGELEIANIPAPEGRLSTTSGSNGEFELRGLRPGVIRLAASTADRVTHAPTYVPLTAGDELAGVEVWVDVLPAPDAGAAPSDPGAPPVRPSVAADAAAIPDGAAGGVVSGVVVDPLGRPAALAWVTARADDGSPLGDAAFTDATGAFTLGRLGAGPVRVSAYALATPRRATQASVRPGDRPLTLTLGGLSTLVLRVRDSAGPVGVYDVALRGPIVRRERIEDADGEGRLRWIDPGDYDLAVVAGVARWSEAVHVPPDSVQSREVVLRR